MKINRANFDYPWYPSSSSDPPSSSSETDFKTLDLIAFNRTAESRFLAILGQRIGWQATDVIADAAYLLDISISTAKRYLAKYTAPSAPFAIVAGRVARREEK